MNKLLLAALLTSSAVFAKTTCDLSPRTVNKTFDAKNAFNLRQELKLGRECDGVAIAYIRVRAKGEGTLQVIVNGPRLGASDLSYATPTIVDRVNAASDHLYMPNTRLVLGEDRIDLVVYPFGAKTLTVEEIDFKIVD